MPDVALLAVRVDSRLGWGAPVTNLLCRTTWRLSVQPGIWPQTASHLRKALGLCLIAWCAWCGAARADPAPGQVEEWAVPTTTEWRQFELAVGEEGYVWNRGSAEAISRSGPPLLDALGEHARGIDIARSADGSMWITEQHEGGEEPDTIGRLQTHGGHVDLREFPIEGTEEFESRYAGPLAIVAGPRGHVWFTDTRPDVQHRQFVGEMATDGHLVARHIVPTGAGPNQAQEPAPHGIALGPEGDVWFTDLGVNGQGHNLIGRFDSVGEVQEFPIPSVGAEPTAIAAGADGAMWFTEPGKNRIGRVTDKGEFEEFAAPGVAPSLKGLALGPEGNLWFAERQPTPGFGSISPAGEVRSYKPTFAPLSLPGYGIGPMSLVLGPDGDIWFTDPRPDEYYPEAVTYEGRFAIPLPPRNTGIPIATGAPLVGEVLSVSTGSWANDATSESYQWQQCQDAAGANCENVVGALGSTYLLSVGDLGKAIRAVVTASNQAGEAEAMSEPAGPIRLAPVSVVTPGVGPAPIAVVGATISSLVRRSARGVSIHALLLHGVPAGSTVSVICRGKGCAPRRSAPRQKSRLHDPCKASNCRWSVRVTHGPVVNLTSLTRPMHLRHGARLLVVVTYPGLIGRAFEFRVGRRGVPSASLSCRAVGSVERIAAC